MPNPILEKYGIREGIFDIEEDTPESIFRRDYAESPNLFEPRLAGLQEGMRANVFSIINEAQARGFDFRLRETRRTPEQQAEKVKKGFSETLKSKHLTGEAFDLVRFKDNKPVWDKESYLPLRDIIKDLDLPIQQGYITKNKWKDWGHIQAPSEKGLYGGLKDYKKLLFPESKEKKTPGPQSSLTDFLLPSADAAQREPIKEEIFEYKPTFVDQVRDIHRRGVSAAEEAAFKTVEEYVPAYLKYGVEAMKLVALRPDVALGISKDIRPEELKLTEASWDDVWKSSPLGKKLSPTMKQLVEHPVASFPQWFAGEFIPSEILAAGTRPSTFVVWGVLERALPAFLHATLKRLPKSAQQFLLRERHLFSRNPLADAYKALEIKPTASYAEVKQGYIKQAMKWHPDRAPKGQELKFQKEFVNRAAAFDRLEKALTISKEAERVASKLRLKKAQAIIPFEKGDLVQLGKDTGKIISIQGGRALIDVAGKEVEASIEELLPIDEQKPAYEMTQEEFKNIPIIKYIKSNLKGMTVRERNELGKQLVDKGLMSVDDFNTMAKQFGFGGKVTPISDIKGKPIPSKPVEGDMGKLVGYIGEWQKFTNVPLFAHREAIIKALVEGKTVPKKVIDEYKAGAWITADGTTRFADRKVTLKDAVESYGVKFNPKQISEVVVPRAGGVSRTIGGLVKQAGYIDPNKALRAGWSKEDIKELRQYMKPGGLSPDTMADELRGSGELLGAEAQYGFPSDVLLEALKEKHLTIGALEGVIPKGIREDTSTGEMIKGVKEPIDFRDIERYFPASEPPPKFPGVSINFLEQPKPKTTVIQYFTPAEYHLKQLGFDREIGQPIREALQNFSIELMKKNEFIKQVQKIHYQKVPKRKRKTSLRKIWDMMDKEIPVGDKSPEALIAGKYREGTIEMLERMNELRVRIGEEPIKGIKNYILYMLKPEFLNEIYATGVIPPELAKVMEYIPPKKVFLRTAELRKGVPEEWLLKDPHALMKAMYAIDLRYIYLQDVLNRIDPYLQAVKDYVGPGGTRWSTEAYKYLDDWVKQAIKMRPSNLDSLVDNLLEYTFAPLLRKVGLKVSHMPWRDLINFLSASVHTGALGMRVKPILRNFVQSTFDWVMYGTSNYLKGSAKFMTKEGHSVLKKSKLWRTRVPYEAQDLATLRRLFKVGGIGYRISDLHNVGKGILTRYYYAVDKLGYSPEKALKWADLDLPRTQWSYRREDLPRAYWSTTGRAFWTLGSWWMNFYTNFMPELLRRGFTGRDVSGRVVSTTERLGILRFLMLIGILHGVKKASRELTGTTVDYTAQVRPRPGFSPIAKMLQATYYFAFGLIDNDKRMLKKGLSDLTRTGKIFIPWELAAEDVFNIFSGKKTWQEVLFYGKQRKPSDKNPILEKYGVGKKKGKNPILKKYGIK